MVTNTQLYSFIKEKEFIGKGGATFRSYCGLGSGEPWCAAFVSYIFGKGGAASLFYGGKKVTYCPNAIRWCEANLAEIPIYLALPMDIIFFDWNGNNVPDHIGFVKERKSADQIYTVEGNTSGGIVAEKTRTLYNEKGTIKYIQGVYRPHFPAKFDVSKPLEIDGYFGYNSIACLQKVLKVDVDGIFGLNTCKAWQKKIGVTADGAWGIKTTKAAQKFLGVKVDGYFGPESVKALQKWINKSLNFPVVNSEKKPEKPKITVVAPITTNGAKIAAKANELAYATDAKTAKYDGGKPKAAYKKALNTANPNRKKWSKPARDGASCDVFVRVVCHSSGVDKNMPRGRDEQNKHLANSPKWKLVTDGSIKDGDVITYIRNDGGGHICIYVDGKIKEAAYNKYYPRTTKTKASKLSKKGKKWVKVYRAV